MITHIVTFTSELAKTDNLSTGIRLTVRETIRDG